MKTRHRIDDIRYGPDAGPSWLVCRTDGARLAAESPDALVDAWVDHGGKADRAASGRGHARRTTGVLRG